MHPRYGLHAFRALPRACISNRKAIGCSASSAGGFSSDGKV